MPRTRGVSRTQVHRANEVFGRNVQRDEDGGGVPSPDSGGAAETAQSVSPGYGSSFRNVGPADRGRTIWGVYVKEGRHLLRAPASCTTAEVRELYEAKTGKAVPTAIFVQAGGFGRAYDAQDSACPVDFDFIEGGEVEEDEAPGIVSPEVEDGDARG